ncbi:MAG: FHA domain-containing protein [Clostridia bacterium]|nr:FHA domain-containing protein [Clostridia bacterium]
MSVFTIENQGVNTYLVYKVTADDEFDSLSFGMLANNKIRGIAPILFTQVDTDKYLKYNISSKVPVSTYFKGTVTRKRLLDVFSGIASAVMAAEEYMVDTSLFIFNIDHIYVDATTNETTIICIPVVNCAHSTVDLQMFYKQIMYSTQFDQSENCDYIAPIINYLNSTQVFSLLDFKKLVDRLNFSAAQSAAVSSASVSVPAAAQPRTQQPAPVVTTPPVQKAPPAATNAAYGVSPKAVPDNTPRNPAQQPALNVQTPGAASGFGAVPVAMPPVPQKAAKPGKAQKKSATVSEAPDAAQGEKQISLVTLLTKFSKENLDLYKAQKANGKSGKKEKAPKAAKQVQAPPVNFAIPGQTPAVPANPSQVAPPAKQPFGAQQAPSKNIAPPVKAPATNSYQQITVAPQKPVNVQQANFGETTVLSSAAVGETTVLGVSPVVSSPVAHLVRIKTGERIAVNKPAFRIGKEKSYVDYFISDNTAISRSHADIIMKGGNYYVVDLNSTNHTFINETIIESGTENLIKAGDKIRFGNEVFDFIML